MTNMIMKEGRPVAMQMRADAILSRAARAKAEGEDPFEVLYPGEWRTVLGGSIGEDGNVWLMLDHASDLYGMKGGSVQWVRWGLGTGMVWIPAHELRVGDEVHNLGEAGVPWKVRELSDRPNTAEPGTSWILANGDNDEGYYERWFGGAAYMAYMSEPVAVSWPRPEREV